MSDRTDDDDDDDDDDRCESDEGGYTGSLPWIGGDDERPTLGGQIFGHVITCSKHSLVMMPGTCNGMPVTLLGEAVMIGGVKSYRVIAMSMEEDLTKAFTFGYADGTPLPTQHAIQRN